MPSGSKKRKAAKKKKENQSNNHPNPSSVSAHAHGGDDAKHHDDKESDVGEVSSPASPDHHSNKNSLTEGEEEIGEGENVSNAPVERVKSEVAGERNIVVEGEGVIPVEREFKIENEFDKKDEKFEHDEAPRKSYDGGPSGSSSSSSSSSDDESHGIKSSQAVVDIAPVVDPIEVADSLSSEKTEAIHSITTKEAGHSAAGPSTVESVFTEDKKKLSPVDNKIGVSEAFKDAALQREEAIIQPVKNIVAIPDTKECIAQESDDRLTLSTNAPVATADNGSNTEKDSGVTEPLLAPAPRPVQRTSWNSCCGLFEVFTGPGR